MLVFNLQAEKNENDIQKHSLLLAVHQLHRMQQIPGGKKSG
jgi:hypothetical protein